MKIAVIIPCYNVEKHIEAVITGLAAEISYIIAVNDFSKDDTENILLRLQQFNKKIIYIKHEKNQGVGGAMLTGFQRSLELNCDITIKMDGDGQMDPSCIPELIKPIIKKKADYTKGNRFRDFSALNQMPVIRRIGNLGLSFFIKAASGYWNIFDPNNGFIAISHEMLSKINTRKIHKRFFFESSLLIELYHNNAVVQDVPMQAKYGSEVSNLSVARALFGFPPKLLKAFLRRIFLRYFMFDFNIASVYILFGFPLFLTGLIFGVVNFIKYASSHEPAPTGTVVIPTLLIILGFQLILSAIQFDITNFPKRNNNTPPDN